MCQQSVGGQGGALVEAVSDHRPAAMTQAILDTIGLCRLPPRDISIQLVLLAVTQPAQSTND